MASVPALPIEDERGFYVGNVMNTILYGFEICIYFQSVYYLITSKANKSSRAFYIIYGGILFGLMTISVIANGYFGQLLWIEHRDVLGGPGAYFLANTALWLNTFGTASSAAANVLGDALLLFRCYIITGSRWQIVVFPSLIWLASTVMAIMTNVISGLPNGNVFKGQSAAFGIAWVSLTVSFNITVTSMICARIFMLQKPIRQQMDADSRRMYTGIIAILVESALPFTVVGIVFIATYVRELPAEWSLAPIWGKFVVISPQLIILRVALGRAWTKDAVSRFSRDMEFATPTQTATAFESTLMTGQKESTAADINSHRSEISLPDRKEENNTSIV